jgi:hypothetical protein
MLRLLARSKATQVKIAEASGIESIVACDGRTGARASRDVCSKTLPVVT